MKVTFEQLKAAFNRVLISRGVDSETADACAEMFARTTESGVYSHGVNRFPRFIQQLENGDIIPDAQPKRITSLGAIEQWDAQRSIGNLTAKKMMDRAIELAADHGIGLVALRNANHWMRGGTYGWLAAEKGCIGICWSNTAPNMPAWGAKDCRIGNNPLILAVPRSDGQHVMVDCALSQFSYGKLESTRLAGRQLPVPGGCDEDGQLTTDPAAIEKSGRALPIGYWKGSGLSILLDLIATLLSGGNAVHTIGTFGDEIGLTQIMIAIDPTKFGTVEENDAVINAILADIKASTPARPDGEVRWPGEGMLRTIKENRELGVPVVEEIWESVLKM